MNKQLKINVNFVAFFTMADCIIILSLGMKHDIIMACMINSIASESTATMYVLWIKHQELQQI